MQPLKQLLLIAIIPVLFSCTTDQHRVLQFVPEDRETLQNIVWPAPPEVPRYRFVGELVGELNLHRDSAIRQGRAERIFRWVVGLGARNNEPEQLVRPQYGMVDQAGRILVTDSGQGRIFVFDPQAGRLLIWDDAGRGYRFRSPLGIAGGINGELLVADGELGRIVRLDTQGEPLGSFGGNELKRPTGIAVDPRTGASYVVDTPEHQIKVFSRGGVLEKIIGRHGGGAAEFNGPTHIALAGDRLYVSDTLNARIQILTKEGAHVQSIGSRGLNLGDLTRPKGVTVDSEGNVYIVESYYDYILVFNDQGEFLLPIGGTGSQIGRFYLPAGIWSDGNNRIFVADMFNSRVFIMQYLGQD